MKPGRISRAAHKWLGLVVGLQLLVWIASGFYMVAVDLDFIHGDSLVRNLDTVVQLPPQTVSIEALQRQWTGIREIRLRALPDDGAAVYEIVTHAGIELIDAAAGRRISPLPQPRVIALARAYYAGGGEPRRALLIATEAERPLEVQNRPPPLWRVDFDDWLETTLYLSPDTGRLVTRRHRFWRWFDFLWALHIMDYRNRTDVNNGLLVGASILGLAAISAGFWLTWYSFGFFRRRATKAAP